MNSKLTVFLVLIIAILLAALGFVAGEKALFAPINKKVQSQNTVVLNPTPTFTATASATPTVTIKEITAGGIMQFPKYKITIPEGWTETKENPAPNSQRIVLSKDVYQITILQGSFGGGQCVYPGDPTPEGPSAVYTNFSDLVDKSGDNFRISYVKQGYAVCQETKYGWANPTLYGAIDIKSPNIPASDTLDEIKSIISSIEKI